MHIIEYVKFISLPPELIVLIVSTLPISELRGAIPLGILHFHFSYLKTYIICIIGNMLPVIPLLLFLKKISSYCMQYKLGNKFFGWWFTRAMKHSRLVEKFEAIGLTLFVAVPFPVTGAWTGTVLATLFAIRFKYAFPSIFFGVLISGLIVTSATLGIQTVT